MLKLQTNWVGGGLFVLFCLFVSPQESRREKPEKKTRGKTSVEAGYWNWQKGWSAAKKDYCCTMAGKGGGNSRFEDDLDLVRFFLGGMNQQKLYVFFCFFPGSLGYWMILTEICES